LFAGNETFEVKKEKSFIVKLCQSVIVMNGN